MAKIRHIAIKVEDQEKCAEFYKKTFGMTEAWRGPVRDDGKRAIYLTDGYINMAVLPARGGREGIDHFGFQVENIEETLTAAEAAGAKSAADQKPRDGRFAEMGVHDPTGQLVDVAAAQEPADRGHTRVVLGRPARPREALAVVVHRAELDDPERLVILADPDLQVERRATGRQPDQGCRHQDHRGGQYQQEHGGQVFRDRLHRHVPGVAGQPGGPDRRRVLDVVAPEPVGPRGFGLEAHGSTPAG